MIEPSSTSRKAKRGRSARCECAARCCRPGRASLSTKLWPTSTICKHIGLDGWSSRARRAQTMTRTPLLITLAAAAALAGCNKENHTIVAGPEPATMTPTPPPMRPVALPPSISAEQDLIAAPTTSSSTSTGCRTISRPSPRRARTIAGPGRRRRGRSADDRRRRLCGRAAQRRRRRPRSRCPATRRKPARPEASLDSPSAALDQRPRRGVPFMHLSRRGFTGGALSAALGGQLGAPALAQARADLAARARRDPRLWRSASAAISAFPA